MLLFADDVVMFAETKDALQDMLRCLEEYAKQWRFEINVNNKSKFMVCARKGVKLDRKESCEYQGVKLERVRLYKYLGVMVNEEGNWKDQVKRVAEKGHDVTAKLRRWLLWHREVSAKVKVAVWKALVAPGMRYGSEVWWTDVSEEKKLEAVQLGAMKDVLRVGRSTTSEFVRGELGLVEMKRARDVAKLGWLGRVLGMGQERLVRRVYDKQWEKGGSRRKDWKNKVNELVKEYGLEEQLERLRVEGGSWGEWKAIVESAVQRGAVEVWRQGVRDGKKLRVYREVKREWGFERYLEGVCGEGEVLMVRFTSGSAVIGEETCRWLRGKEESIDVGGLSDGEEERRRCERGGLCVCCDEGVVESLEHMLVVCPLFADLRTVWIDRVETVLTGVVDGAAIRRSMLNLMLGWRNVPNFGVDHMRAVICASAAYFVGVWRRRVEKKTLSGAVQAVWSQ
jgi:hypothetical protein